MNKRKVQVAIFYCDAKGSKYFLLLKTNETRGFFWQSITGGVEKTESFLEASRRELFEETQIQELDLEFLKETDYEFCFTDQWKNKCIEKCYVGKLKSKKEITLDPSEHIDYKWINEKDISKNSVKYETNYNLLSLAKNL